jgi:hypothetical protein
MTSTNSTTPTTKTPLIGKLTFTNSAYHTYTFNLSRYNNDDDRFDKLLGLAESLADQYPRQADKKDNVYLPLVVKEYKDNVYLQVQTRLNFKQRRTQLLTGEQYELELRLKKALNKVTVVCKSIKILADPEYSDSDSDDDIAF